MNTLEYTNERELTDSELETVTGGYHRHHHRHFRFEDYDEDRDDDTPKVILVPVSSSLINAPVTVG